MLLIRNHLLLPSLRRFSGTSLPSTLKIGDTLRAKRVFTEEAVLQYSKLCDDANPLHFDSVSAKDAGFEDRVVHGLLVASLFPRIIASHFPGAVYISQSLQFKLPVYIGDEVVGEVEFTHIKGNKKGYVAKFSTRCIKSGKLVIQGEGMAILPTLTVGKGDSSADRS